MKQSDNFSFIIAPKTLENTLRTIQSTVTTTQQYMNTLQEGTKEMYKSYLEHGTDHVIKERQKEMTEYFERTNAPQYLRASQMEIAIENLGADNVKYWGELPQYIPIKAQVNGKPLSIDIDADIYEHPDSGEWLLSQSLVDKVTAMFARWLTDEEMEAVKKMDKLAEMYDELKSQGYDMADALPRWNATTDNSVKAESLCNSYNALLDTRLSEADREEIKRNRQSFFNCF